MKKKVTLIDNEAKRKKDVSIQNSHEKIFSSLLLILFEIHITTHKEETLVQKCNLQEYVFFFHTVFMEPDWKLIIFMGDTVKMNSYSNLY